MNSKELLFFTLVFLFVLFLVQLCFHKTEAFYDLGDEVTKVAVDDKSSDADTSYDDLAANTQTAAEAASGDLKGLTTATQSQAARLRRYISLLKGKLEDTETLATSAAAAKSAADAVAAASGSEGDGGE